MYIMYISVVVSKKEINLLGEMFQFDYYCSDGLKPPPRYESHSLCCLFVSFLRMPSEEPINLGFGGTSWMKQIIFYPP